MPDVSAVHVVTAMQGGVVAPKPTKDGRPRFKVQDLTKKTKKQKR